SLVEKELDGYLSEVGSCLTPTLSSRLWFFQAGAAKRHCGAVSRSRIGLLSLSRSGAPRNSCRVRPAEWRSHPHRPRDPDGAEIDRGTRQTARAVWAIVPTRCRPF